MTLQQVDVISFTDEDTMEEGFVVVRAGHGRIALALSLQSDGDIEVMLHPGICERLVTAIQRATQTAQEAKE